MCEDTDTPLDPVATARGSDIAQSAAAIRAKAVTIMELDTLQAF